MYVMLQTVHESTGVHERREGIRMVARGTCIRHVVDTKVTIPQFPRASVDESTVRLLLGSFRLFISTFGVLCAR